MKEIFLWGMVWAQLPFEPIDSSAVWQKVHSLSLEEKIGQLLMIPVSSTTSNAQEVEKLIRQYHIGGIIFMKGSPYNQAQLTNRYQKIAQIPLLIAMDAEWGVAMRLDSVAKLPYALTLGALAEDSLVYQAARFIAVQCRRLRVHVNFGPVADINSNPHNPVIGIRSFGENKHRATQRALLYMKGLQDYGVVAVAKHFPGHGDTHLDSHEALPIIPHDTTRLQEIELYPFKELIRHNCMGIMIGHLRVLAYDTLTATISPAIVTTLLRKKLGFQGLIFSDALNMKAVSTYYAPGDLEVQALRAGNDILLYVENIPLVVKAIKEAVFSGVLSESLLDEKVFRLLALKKALRLHQPDNCFIPLPNLLEDLQPPLALLEKLYTQNLTLVENRNALLPLTDLSPHRIAYVQIGYERPSPFYRYLLRHHAMPAFVFPNPNQLTDSLLAPLRDYNVWIVGLYQITFRVQKRMRPPLLDFLCNLNRSGGKVILCVFGNPYSLAYLGEESAILVGYEEDTLTQWAAAGAIFGTFAPKGQLPITLEKQRSPPSYDPRLQRPFLPLRFDTRFVALDTFLAQAHKEKLFHDAALAIIYRDTLVYAQGYGKANPYTTLFDIASLTKVAMTTLVAMKLYEEGKLPLYAPLETYFPPVKNKPLGKISAYHLLTHTAGLPAYLPYWKEALVDTLHFQPLPSDSINLPLSRNLYMHKKYPGLLREKIYALDAAPSKMVYSDLGMIVLGDALSFLVKKELFRYAWETFYRPMGLNRITYNPGWRCEEDVVPSTIDLIFRKDTLRGYVHDPTAALLGGIAPHAGLFASAVDLARLLSMLAKEGEYATGCYLDPITIRTFTQKQKDIRRGLGWDKPEKRKELPSPTARCLSAEAYGHLGFTGCAAWVDPQKKLVIVFLSNRTFPTENDPRFNEANIRTRVVEKVCEILGFVKGF
ncbi:MAG: glycoside hydrolase family 3 N-terminal domain-containing protein [Bacteroidia bacterium]